MSVIVNESAEGATSIINYLKIMSMKKIICMTIFAAMICQSGFSRGKTERNTTNQRNTVEALFNSFSKDENTHVKVGGLVMLLAGAFTDTMGITSVEVFTFSDKQVKDRLNNSIKNLRDSSYETLVSTTQNGERTKVLVKIKDDYINEIVVVAGGDEPTLVRIKGKIKPEDVQNIVNNNK